MSKFEIVKNKALSLGADYLKRSSRKHKKYMISYKGKIIHFGDKRFEDFLDHKNETRRSNYRRRARGIKNKKGQKTYLLKESPNYWSYNILW